ncbi:MAG: hypothetical protein AAGI24_13375 [Pseudomonadota bacterium]
MSDIAGTTVKEKMIEEFKAYWIITIYLWASFSLLLVWKASLIPTEEARALSFGAAFFKAAVIGKFILVGKAMKVGARLQHNRLVKRIAWKSIATMLLLAVFAVLEEFVVGLLHGEAVSAIAAELQHRSVLDHLAPSMIMLLVLVPMITFEEVDLALGKGKLIHLLFSRDK